MMKHGKNILMFTLILGLGFILGFVTSGALRTNRVKKMAGFRGEEIYWEHLLRQIDATPQQKEKILPIVKNYGGKTRTIMEEAREEVVPLMDSLYHEIDPLLTKEQKEKIKVITEKRKRWLRGDHPQHRRPKHPNHPRDPGERRKQKGVFPNH